MKAALIMNPAAGKGKPLAVQNRIEETLQNHGIDCEILLTCKTGDAVTLARDAAAQGHRLVIAAGGDGTVNEVVNGIAGTGATLGILPVGTVNVLARELKIPLDLGKALKVLAHGNVRHMDLGSANGQYFTLMAGFGFDAEVVANVLQPIKDIIGSTAYILKGLETLAKYEATEITLEMPHETVTSKAFVVVVANVSRYTYTLKLAPYASPDDGLLDICVFERPIMDKVGFAGQIADVFLNRHTSHSAVKYYKARSVKISSDPGIMVQLDGDAFGVTPVEVCAIPRALPVIAPKIDS